MMWVLLLSLLLTVEGGDLSGGSNSGVSIIIKGIGSINVNVNADNSGKIDKLSSQILQVKNSLVKLSEKVDHYHPASTSAPPPKPTHAGTTGSKPITIATATTEVATTTTLAPSTTPASPWVCYPPETRQYCVKRRYPEYDLQYVGFGAAGNYSKISENKASSFEDCIQICVNERTQKGADWNGVTFKYGLDQHFLRCVCHQGARGFLPYVGFLHYRFTSTAGQWVFYPPGTKIHRVKRVYPEYGDIEYAGFGGASGYTDSSEYRASSLEECIQKCVKLRDKKGVSWNAVTYKYSMDDHFLRCVCREGATGFIPYDSYLHYRFQSSKPPPPQPPTSAPWIFYPPGTRDHQAKGFYPDYSLKYVGFGTATDYSHSSEHAVSSFEECVKTCAGVRKSKGVNWNAVTYKFMMDKHFLRCACHEKATGFLPYQQYLHYTFQYNLNLKGLVNESKGPN